MGLKLEIAVTLMIIVIISVTTMVKLTNNAPKKHASSNELEFNNTTFIEVDMMNMQAKAFSTYGVRSEGVLTLTNLKYHTSNIRELLADKGIYNGEILHLDGNVSMHTKEGFDYSTHHATYNQKTQILNITAPFVAKMQKNIILGNSLQYNAVKKEAKGESIDAIVYTVEK